MTFVLKGLFLIFEEIPRSQRVMWKSAKVHPRHSPRPRFWKGLTESVRPVSKDIPWTVAKTLKPVRNVIIVPQGTGLRF